MLVNLYQRFLKEISKATKSKKIPKFIRGLLIWYINLPEIFRLLMAIIVLLLVIFIALVVIYISVLTSFLLIITLASFPKIILLVAGVIIVGGLIIYLQGRKE